MSEIDDKFKNIDKLKSVRKITVRSGVIDDLEEFIDKTKKTIFATYGRDVCLIKVRYYEYEFFIEKTEGEMLVELELISYKEIKKLETAKKISEGLKAYHVKRKELKKAREIKAEEQRRIRQEKALRAKEAEEERLRKEKELMDFLHRDD